MAVGDGVDVAVGVVVTVAVGVADAVAVAVFVSVGAGVTVCVVFTAGEGVGVKFGMMPVHPSKKMPTVINMSSARGKWFMALVFLGSDVWRLLASFHDIIIPQSELFPTKTVGCLLKVARPYNIRACDRPLQSLQ